MNNNQKQAVQSSALATLIWNQRFSVCRLERFLADCCHLLGFPPIKVTYIRILKSNCSWSPTWMKFLQDNCKFICCSILTYGRILKSNLSWTRKKSNSSDAKFFSSVFIFFFFVLKAKLQALKFGFCRIKLGLNHT